MPVAGKGNTVQLCTQLAQPLADQMGLLLWDVRFEKEGSAWFLRFFIDKEGGVTIDDCADFSRAVEKLVDEADPIDQSYFLEVSSPGTERELVRPWHFQRYVGSRVTVRLIRPVQGQKELVGRLAGFEDGCVRLEPDGQQEVLAIPKSERAFVRLVDEFEFKGEAK